MNIISKTIKLRAKESGLSINKLEQNAGLKKGTLYNILLGRSKNPGINTLQQLAAVLNCSVNDLFEDKSTNEIGTDNASTDADNWNSVFYGECILFLIKTAEIRNVSIKKQDLLTLADEIYSYCSRIGLYKVDENFALWLFEKSYKT